MLDLALIIGSPQGSACQDVYQERPRPGGVRHGGAQGRGVTPSADHRTIMTLAVGSFMIAGCEPRGVKPADSVPMLTLPAVRARTTESRMTTMRLQPVGLPETEVTRLEVFLRFVGKTARGQWVLVRDGAAELLICAATARRLIPSHSMSEVAVLPEPGERPLRTSNATV